MLLWIKPVFTVEDNTEILDELVWSNSPCYCNNKHERAFLCKYQQMQKYKVENDKLCCSTEDLKILGEQGQVPPDLCKTEKSSLQCVVGSLSTWGAWNDTLFSWWQSWALNPRWSNWRKPSESRRTIKRVKKTCVNWFYIEKKSESRPDKIYVNMSRNVSERKSLCPPGGLVRSDG